MEKESALKELQLKQEDQKLAKVQWSRRWSTGMSCLPSRIFSSTSSFFLGAILSFRSSSKREEARGGCGTAAAASSSRSSSKTRTEGLLLEQRCTTSPILFISQLQKGPKSATKSTHYSH